MNGAILGDFLLISAVLRVPASQPKSISQKGVHTDLSTAQSANADFMQHFEPFLAAVFGLNSANTLLCDTLALSRKST